MRTGQSLRIVFCLSLSILLVLACQKQSLVTPKMSTNLFPPPPPPPFPPPPIRIWLNSANIPLTTGGWTGRFSMASFTLNGKGYLAAGGVMDASSRQSTSTDVLCYDPTTGTWSQKAAFPGSARTGTASFAINNYGYICTGVAANFSTPTTENWRYDPNQNWWTRKAPFPGYARSYAVGVALNGKGYLGTGAPTSGGADGGLLDWWQYDPVADSWTAKRNMPGTIGRWGAVAFANDQPGGKAYVMTGIQWPYASALGGGWAYDPSSDAWSAIPALPDTVPGRCYAVGLSTPEGGIIGSGYNGWNYNDFWMLNFSTNTWSKLASIPGQRWQAQGFTIGQYVYVGGGLYGLGDNPPQPKNDFYSLYYW